jgi:hypothetical protein
MSVFVEIDAYRSTIQTERNDILRDRLQDRVRFQMRIRCIQGRQEQTFRAESLAFPRNLYLQCCAHCLPAANQRHSHTVINDCSRYPAIDGVGFGLHLVQIAMPGEVVYHGAIVELHDIWPLRTHGLLQSIAVADRLPLHALSRAQGLLAALGLDSKAKKP